MAAGGITVKLNSTNLPLDPMLPPTFIVELRFHSHYRKLLRTLEGNLIEVEAYPISPTSFVRYRIHPLRRHLFVEPLCKSYLDVLFSSVVHNDSLRDVLSRRIASFLVFLARRQPFLGYYVVADSEFTHEDLIEGYANDLTMIIDEEHQEVVQRVASSSALNKLKEQRFFAKQGDDDGRLSDDCVICLEELSNSEVALTKLTCTHIFHEQCILDWLKAQNSCPTCRRELED